MPNGLYSIIETKLNKILGCAENIKKQQRGEIKAHRSGLSSYENAKHIIETTWEIMSIDLPSLVKEYEKSN